jgi:hypothetical protein
MSKIEPRHRGLLGGIFEAKSPYCKLEIPEDTAVPFSSVIAGWPPIKTSLSNGCQSGSERCSCHPICRKRFPLLRGEFRQFSVERLLRFLVALGQDVEIVIKPHRARNKAAALHVA